MKCKILFLGLIFFLIPSSVFASCDTNGYTVVYVNGVLTSKTDALYDSEKLQSKIGLQFHNQPLAVRLGYNPTHLAGADDFLTSIAQIYAQGKHEYVDDADLDTILRQIQPELKTRKILLVGHSQGTFYTNAMYQYLLAHGASEGAVAVYNVATPADYVAGNGKYLTSTNDAAIAQVRSLAEKFHAPAPLPANITIPAKDASSSYPGHSFIDDYLAGAPSRIVSDMQTELGWLKVSGGTTAISGCFDAPQLTDRDALSAAFYTVDDPVFATGVREIRGGADIAVGVERGALALAKAAYAASIAAGEGASRAVAAATNELYSSLNDMLALHSDTAASSTPVVSNGQSASVGEALVQHTPSPIPSNDVGNSSLPASAPASMPKPVLKPAMPSSSAPLPQTNPSLGAAVPTSAPNSPALAENGTVPPPASEPALESTNAAPPPQDAAPVPPPQEIEAGPIAVSPGFGGGAPTPAPNDSHRTENASTGAPPSSAKDTETASSTGAVSTSTAPASGSQSAGINTASTTNETASSTEDVASSTPALATPVISVPACAHSLAPSGKTCLLATTSVELAWAEVPGAAHYEVNVGVQAAGSNTALATSTTATSSRLRLTDEAVNSITISVFDEHGDEATSSPVSVYAFESPVRINEVSWAGTGASSSDQWLELANRSNEPLALSHFSLAVSSNAEDTGDTVLTGTVPQGSGDGPGFAVFYRARALQDILSAQFLAAFPLLPLAGAQLQLLAQTANGEVLMDETPSKETCGGWCAGEEENELGPGSPVLSMERVLLNSSGSDSDNWQDNDGVIMDGLDASSSPVYGTPGAQNSDPAEDWANSGGPTLQ